MIEPKNGYLTVAPVYLSEFTCLSTNSAQSCWVYLS